MKAKIVKEHIDDDEDDYNLAVNTKRAESEFFIDPQGNIHKYKGDLSRDIYSMHTSIASRLFPEKEYPEDYMMENGWMVVGSTVYNCPIINKKPTNAQIETLKELGLYNKLCALYKNTYPNYEKYKGLWD